MEDLLLFSPVPSGFRWSNPNHLPVNKCIGLVGFLSRRHFLCVKGNILEGGLGPQGVISSSETSSSSSAYASMSDNSVLSVQGSQWPVWSSILPLDQTDQSNGYLCTRPTSLASLRTGIHFPIWKVTSLPPKSLVL